MYTLSNLIGKNGIIFILFCRCVFGSVMDSIQIVGNVYTHPKIILREIQHPIPGALDSSMLLKDKNRIYNLGIFSSVEIVGINSTYKVSVRETFRFLPFPLIDYDEGKGISYGGGIAFINFRGLNQKLSVGMLFGQEKTWFFNFEDPWITGDHVSFNTGIYNYHSDGAVYAYKYQEKGGYVGTGIYVGEENKFQLKIGIESITLDTTHLISDNRWRLPEMSLIHKYAYLNLTYQYDSRDIFIDPTTGHHLVVHFKPRIGLKNSQNHNKLSINYARYIQLSKAYGNPVISFKSSLLIQSSENLQPFSFVYIGGEDYVRGYSPIPWQNPESTQHDIEGYHALYQSIQLQHSLIRRKDYGGSELGIDMVYFIDTGFALKNIRVNSKPNILVGYGVGFRFFVSGSGSIGIDFGFNPFGSYFIHPTSGN